MDCRVNVRKLKKKNRHCLIFLLMCTLCELMYDIPNDPRYGMLHHKEQLDVGLVPVEEAEEGEIVGDVHQARGLGDHQLVRVGQRHLVLIHIY